jgi:hypothetical protein
MTFPHQHLWKLHAYLDDCHSYSSTYTCECGARRETFDERTPMGDPYSVMMMNESCERCSALLAGAVPESRDEIRGGVA